MHMVFFPLLVVAAMMSGAAATDACRACKDEKDAMEKVPKTAVCDLDACPGAAACYGTPDAELTDAQIQAKGEAIEAQCPRSSPPDGPGHEACIQRLIKAKGAVLVKITARALAAALAPSAAAPTPTPLRYAPPSALRSSTCSTRAPGSRPRRLARTWRSRLCRSSCLPH